MMNFSKEMIEKAKTASSAEELLEMAKAEGIDLSAAEAETFFSFLTKGSQSLSDKELEQVAGGKGGEDKPTPKFRIDQYLYRGSGSSRIDYCQIQVKSADYSGGEWWYSWINCEGSNFGYNNLEAELGITVFEYPPV